MYICCQTSKNVYYLFTDEIKISSDESDETDKSDENTEVDSGIKPYS